MKFSSAAAPNISHRYIYLTLLPFCVMLVMAVLLVSARYFGYSVANAYALTTTAAMQPKLSLYGSSYFKTIMMIVTRHFGFAGPIHMYLVYFPFNLAFPEICGYHRWTNIFISIGIYAAFLLNAVVNVVFSAEIQSIGDGLGKGLLALILYFVGPLIWRKRILGYQRNQFLMQLEHDWVCCRSEVAFRTAGVSVLEWVCGWVWTRFIYFSRFCTAWWLLARL